MKEETKEEATSKAYKITSLVALVYFIKTIAKIYIGYVIVNSPVVAGEGFHSGADFFIALVVLFSIWIGGRPPSIRFPNAPRYLQGSVQFGVLFLLTYLAFDVFLKCFTGILRLDWFSSVRNSMASHGYFLPSVPPLIVDEKFFWLVFGVMAISAVTSFILGLYQIAIGRRAKQDAVVADGYETISDGYAESIASIGILGEYKLGMPWIEYPLGFIVMIIILYIAKKIGAMGIRKLLGIEEKPQ